MLGCVALAGVGSSPCMRSGMAGKGLLAEVQCSPEIGECPGLYCHELFCKLLFSSKSRCYSSQ